MKHIKRSCFVGIVFLFMVCFFSSLHCDAAKRKEKTVRVAYFHLEDYYKEKDGKVDSYDFAYLEKIAEYANLKLEYVNCKTWANALRMLEKHQVDIVGTVQWDKEREKKYEYCFQDYGFSVAELCCLPERDFSYRDYEKIGKSKIGLVKGYIRQKELNKMLASHRISPKIKTYNTQDALNEALLSGEIDLAAANSHTLLNEWKVVEKFSYNPFFFVSWKGNTSLMNAINNAMIQIHIYEADYDDELMKQYFPSLVKLPFTKEEMRCIQKKRKLRVHFDKKTKPLAWQDSSGKILGILPDICKKLGEKTGLIFEFVPYEKEQKLEDNDVSYRVHMAKNVMNRHDISKDGRTGDLFNGEFLLYHRVWEDYNPKNRYRVAFPENRTEIHQSFLEKYPKNKVVTFKNPEKCLEAVWKGKADLAFLDNDIANDYFIEMDMHGIVSIPITAVPVGIYLQFRGKDAAILSGIVDKGLNQITDEELNTIKLHYALKTVPKTTIPYIVKNNMLLAFLIGMVVVILISTAVVLALRNYLIRQESRRVEAANSARAEFFSRISHDMRTPMNGILGMVDLSEREENIDVLHDNMKRIRESGDYLLRLINDTLDLQKIESGKMELEEQVIQSRKLVESVVDMVKMTAKQKNIDFSVENRGAELDLYIKCDTLRVRQIFVNLLSNAIKFTPDGGRVSILIERLDRTDNVVHDRMQITDNGVGMSESFIKGGLFKAYSQERSRMSAKYAGSGLGLAITKTLIEMMGGKIEVESRLGEGSAFTVYLAFTLVDKETALEELRKTQEKHPVFYEKLRGKKVLLCEEHPLNAEIVRKYLKKADCSVVWKENGKEGVRAFAESEEGEFAAILMDLRMPVMDGIAAAEEIRKMQRQDAADVPIIAMTADVLFNDANRVLASGMNAYVAKPVDSKELLYVLSNAFE